MDKPPDIFDRSEEWARLTAFVGDNRPVHTLAVVYGRRRQGKSYLLQRVAEFGAGLYWEASQQSAHQNLASFAAAWTASSGSAVPFRPLDWDEMLTQVFTSSAGPQRIVIDEVGHLIDSSPEFPSLLQRWFNERPTQAPRRIVLCGSVYAQMTNLIAAGAPLRGRQSLNLRIDPFDYRTAAAFWGLADHPTDAFRLHALIGGTPAYLRFCGGAGPRPGRLGPWAIDHLLDPASPLYHEGTLLIADDPSLTDKSLYWGVLNAVVDGYNRRSALAKQMGRPPTSLGNALTTLEAAGWIEHRADPLHAKASTILMTEPLLRTHRTVLVGERLRLDRGAAKDVWADAQTRLGRYVYAPHLEWLASEFLLRYADSATVGGRPRLVGPSILRSDGEEHQLDVVAVEATSNGDRVCAIGEVKSGVQRVGESELERLDACVGRLGKRAGESVKRILVSEMGFTRQLERTSQRRDDVELIDLVRLYTES